MVSGLSIRRHRVLGHPLQLWHRPHTHDAAIFDEVLASYRLPELLEGLAAGPAQPRIVDIGAHIGGFTLLVGACLPGASIEAYEMMRDNVALLRRNVSANGLADRVRVHHAVVADVAGRWDPADHLYGTDGNTGGASVAHCAFSSPHPPTVTVPVVPAAEVLAGPPIDLLKLDCEGSEFRIVYSAGEALDRVRTVVGELHDAAFAGRRTSGWGWHRQDFLDCLRSRFPRVTAWQRRSLSWGTSEQFLAQR